MQTIRNFFMLLLILTASFCVVFSQIPQLNQQVINSGPNLNGVVVTGSPLFQTTTTTLSQMSLSVFATSSDPNGLDPTIGQPVNPVREIFKTFEAKSAGIITVKVVTELKKLNFSTAAIPQVVTLKLVDPLGRTVDSVKNISLYHLNPREFTLRGSANATTSGCTANNQWKIVLLAASPLFKGQVTGDAIATTISPEKDIFASPSAGYALVTNQIGDFTFQTPISKSGKITIIVDYTGGSIPVEMQLFKPGSTSIAFTQTRSGTATYTFKVESTDQPNTNNNWKIKLTNKGAQLIQNAKVKIVFSECR